MIGLYQALLARLIELVLNIAANSIACSLKVRVMLNMFSTASLATGAAITVSPDSTTRNPHTGSQLNNVSDVSIGMNPLASAGAAMAAMSSGVQPSAR